MNSLRKNSSFQDILIKLSDFWNNFGCVLIPPAQTEISSPLFHPSAFFNMIDDDNCINIMYFQPQVASMDNKAIKYSMQNYTLLKFQVVLNLEIDMPQKIFLDSLIFLGFDFVNNNIFFDNFIFDNFIFRLKANGYQVFFNGISIGKILYIQNVGSSKSKRVLITISYDIDKILTIMQNCYNIWNVNWNAEDNKNAVLYRDIMLFSEMENYKFILNNSSNEILFKQLENYKDMAFNLIESGIVLPAYISILKAKYYLDVLTIRNYITYNTKMTYNRIFRDLIDLCCEKYNKNKNINE